MRMVDEMEGASKQAKAPQGLGGRKVKANLQDRGRLKLTHSESVL